MNATQRLIKAVEEVFRLSQLDYDGIDILVQRSAANQEVKEALAAAKEEAGRRVLTDKRAAEIGMMMHPDDDGAQIVAMRAAQFVRDHGYLAPTTGLDVEGVMKLVREMPHFKLMYKPGSHGAGVMDEEMNDLRKALEAHIGVRELPVNFPGQSVPRTDPAINVEQVVKWVMRAFERSAKHTVVNGPPLQAMRKRFKTDLEAIVAKVNAEKGGGNLRKDPWISAEDRLPDEGDYEMSAYVLGWTGDEVVKCFYTYRYQEWRTDTGYVHRTIASWMPLPAPPDNTDKG